MPNACNYPDQDLLRQRLHYAPVAEPENCLVAGDWLWLQDIYHPNGKRLVQAGDRAGHKRGDGSVVIGIGGRIFPAHRLAFVYMTGACPEGAVHHIDGDKANNAWVNLRTRVPSLTRSTYPDPMGSITVATQHGRHSTSTTITARQVSSLLVRAGPKVRSLQIRHLANDEDAAEHFRVLAASLQNKDSGSHLLSRRGTKVSVMWEKTFSDDGAAREAVLEEASRIFDEMSAAA